jgi:hypothetical protein
MNVNTILELIGSMVKSATVTNTEGAYGSGLAVAGARFDPISFVKKPQVIIRLVSTVNI